MSTRPHDPQRSVTVQDVDAWLHAARERRAQLHLQATSPCNSDERQEAFTAMSALLLEALEEVRVVSEAMRERSQAACNEATDLRAHATQLVACGTALMARLAQFASPSPQAIQEAESQLLKLFKGEKGQRTS
jgi:hypothetical protein